MFVFQIFFFDLVFSKILFPKWLEHEYWTSIQDNKLEYLLISCQTCNEAAVSMSVKVGSFQDPIPGLSHLLEHMLFFSSKTYPQENYLMEFINSHSGYINAFTESDHTNYYYSIDNTALEDSLKIFSRIFVDPVFSSQAVEREIMAVDSEHHKNVYNDGWRTFRLLEISAKNSEFRNFGTGNAKTLAVPRIAKFVENHFLKYYFGENMKLVIYGNYSLNTLNQWVNNYFSDVRKGNFKSKPIYDFEIEGLMLTEKISEGTSLDLFWKIPSEYKSTQPGGFVAYLLNNQGTDGLIAKFDSIQKMSVEVIKTYSEFSLINANFFLHKEFDYKNIISATIEYIKKILTFDKNKLNRIWFDYSKIAQNSFDYSNELEPSQIVKKLSSNMLNFSEKYFFSGFDLKHEFDYEEVQKILKSMQGQFLAIFESSRFNKGKELDEYVLEFKEYDEYYDLHYDFFPFKTNEINLNFDVYPINPCIPYDLELKKYSNSEIEQKSPIEGLKIWYKYDQHFKTPTVIVSILLTFEAWEKNQVNLNIIIEIANIMITKNLYLYKIAGYSYSLENTLYGLVLVVTGWNDKICEYLANVLKEIITPNTSFYHSAWVAVYEKYSLLETTDAYIQADEYLKEKILLSYVPISKQLQVLLNYLKDNSLNRDIIKKVAIEVLITGNIEPKVCEDITEILLENFIISNNKRLTPVSKNIQNKEFFYFSHSNHCILQWYDFDEFDIRKYAAIMILSDIANSLAFQVLRSKEQLGYIVFLYASLKYKTNAIKLLIQGSNKDPDYMEFIIQQFWENLEIENEKFEKSKIAISKSLVWPKTTLENLNNVIWKEILQGRYDFQLENTLSKAVKNVKITEVYDLINQIKTENRKITIKIFKETETKMINDIIDFL